MDIEDNDIRLFQKSIQENSVYDFNDYSLNSLRRRINKIREEYKVDLSTINKRLEEDPEFLEQVVKHITVNTTDLFRDPLVWKKLLHQVLPRYEQLSGINIWHSGCSTGQEVYSMMILLDQAGILDKTTIYASDINSDVLEVSKKGQYRYRFNKEYLDNYNTVFDIPVNESSRKTDQSWKKYFKIDETKDLITMQDFLLKKPVYRTHDLVKDSPLFKESFDLIICRNVIIYFNYDLQNRVLKNFLTHLNHRGCLLLGLHESIIGPFSNSFMKDDQFYFKKNI